MCASPASRAARTRRSPEMSWYASPWRADGDRLDHPLLADGARKLVQRRRIEIGARLVRVPFDAVERDVRDHAVRDAVVAAQRRNRGRRLSLTGNQRGEAPTQNGFRHHSLLHVARI